MGGEGGLHWLIRRKSLWAIRAKAPRSHCPQARHQMPAPLLLPARKDTSWGTSSACARSDTAALSPQPATCGAFFWKNVAGSRNREYVEGLAFAQLLRRPNDAMGSKEHEPPSHRNSVSGEGAASPPHPVASTKCWQLFLLC
jgi:hypothetical protein